MNAVDGKDYKMKTISKATIWLTVFLLLGTAVLGLIYSSSTGAFIRARHVNVPSPERAVADARRLIADFQKTRKAGQESKWLRIEELPESLKIPKLRFAAVFTNHLNLVMGRNPDWSVGARIWLDRPPERSSDQPTRFPGVYFYEYCNDFPTSASNHP